MSTFDNEFLPDVPDEECPACQHLRHHGLCLNPECELSRPACLLCGKKGCRNYSCQPEFDLSEFAIPGEKDGRER